MNNARIRMPLVFKGMSKNSIKSMIEENIYNEKYKDIAIFYYVFEECQIDIAYRYGVDKKTIKRVLDKVVDELGMV